MHQGGKWSKRAILHGFTCIYFGVELSRLQYKYTYRCKYTQTNKYFGAAHISLLKVAAFNWTPSCLSNLVFGISMRKMFACTHNSYEWHIAAVPRLTRTRNVFSQTSGKNPGAVQKCMHWAIFFLALISCFKEILLILHQIPGAFTLFWFSQLMAATSAQFV